MKKLITILLTILMVITLAGCDSDKESSIEQTEIIEPSEETLVGGYTDAENNTITEDLKEIFDKALNGLLGANYEPVELVATQVVAGINYKFLAKGTKTTNPPVEGKYYITIYKDLDGNVELKDIEVIEENTIEAQKEEEKAKDITQMYFWVVFYDQNGYELQREALKYGTVPEYKTSLPEGFDKWVYKKSGKDVDSFKTITGNTYYQAVCHEVYHSSSAPAPTPSPTVFNIRVESNEYGSACAKVADIKVYTAEAGTTVKLVPTPNEGYHFKEWEVIHGDISVTDENEFVMPSNDVKVKAIFEEDGEACLAKGTLITMADGSKQAIEDLYEGDLIRVFDHDTGKVSNAKIMDYWQYEEKKSGLITLHFTNCIDINIVTAHGFYNKEENKYVVLDANNINSYIGKHFYNVDNNSWETLLSATYSNEKVDTFFIATEGQFDIVAEGMLNVEDGIYYLLRNTFDFDENMKVDQIKKSNDIKEYGLFDNSDFEYLTEEAFEKYGFAYLKVSIGKGIINESVLDVIREGCLSYESENIVEEYIPENVQHSVR